MYSEWLLAGILSPNCACPDSLVVSYVLPYVHTYIVRGIFLKVVLRQDPDL